MAAVERRHGTVLVVLASALVAVSGVSACSDSAPVGGATARPHPFSSYRVEGRTVVVAFTGVPDQPGPCGADYRAEASETVDRVYIRLQELPHAAPPGEAVCPAIAQLRTAVVTLERPLGPRAVVDGATGEIVLQPRPTAPTSP